MKLTSVLALLLVSLEALALTPPVSGGEVKILYPCSSLSELSVEKEESEVITFFEKGTSELHDLGIILRLREYEDGKNDFTSKYRDPRDKSFVLDDEIYKDLSESQAGELKCEADVTFHPVHPKSTISCSWKSDTKVMEQEHFDFVKMVGVTLPVLEGLREVKVRSTSWKLAFDESKLANSPIKKKPTVERWEFRNECLLEVSAKFDAKVTDPARVYSKAREAMSFLKKMIPVTPSSVQGSKTSRALGI